MKYFIVASRNFHCFRVEKEVNRKEKAVSVRYAVDNRKEND